MAQTLKYPIGVQSFAEIREGGYVYIDKTAYIHRLVSEGKYYFLSRPRRFGKSLLLSTIEEYFSGRRDLFEGLDAIRLGLPDHASPVFHLSMNRLTSTGLPDLRSQLAFMLWELEEKFGVPHCELRPALRFSRLITSVAETTGCKVVILIDEYDKPLLDNAGDEHRQRQMRDEMKGFYSNLKNLDSCIEFAFLTGVSKFGQLSIFSDLNNLEDISQQTEYAGICGVTECELHDYLSLGVARMAERTGASEESTYALLKENYDGYHFSPRALDVDVYNPFSLFNALKSGEISDYWFQTGTPTFLVEMIKDRKVDLSRLDDYSIDLNRIGSVSFNLGDYVPVLYQSGYLTIKSFDTRFRRVRLGYPNREVEHGFIADLMSIYTSTRRATSEFDIDRFVRDVESGAVDDFMARLRSLFSGYHYDQMDLGNLELHYRNVIYLVAKLMGFYVEAEMRTSEGRIDLIVGTKEYLYVFEFKLDGTPEEALCQIDDRQYDLPFRRSGRHIVRIGASFSSRSRTIAAWIVAR